MRRALVLALVSCGGGARPAAPADAAVLEIAIAPPPSLVTLVAPSLTGDNAAQRTAAIEAIARLAVRGTLTAEDAATVLAAAPRMEERAQATLIDAVTLSHDPAIAAPLAEVTPSLHPAARERALVGLARLDDPAIAPLLAPDDAAAFLALASPPRKETVLAIAPRVAEPALAPRVIALVAEACDRGVVGATELAPDAPPLVAAYAGQPALLDVFACLPGKAVEADLRAAVGSDDPDAAIAAAGALFAERRLAPPMIARLAADDRTRARVFALVGARRMPKAARDQEALARSLLVAALPTPPDQIEPATLVPVVITPDLTVDHYVFRFHAADGWHLGVAGPFVHGDEPTVEDHAGTFVDPKPAGLRDPASLVDVAADVDAFTD